MRYFPFKMSLSSWKDIPEVLAAASDPTKLSAIAESLSSEEEKEFSRNLKRLEEDEPLLKHNPSRWVCACLEFACL